MVIIITTTTFAHVEDDDVPRRTAPSPWRVAPTAARGARRGGARRGAAGRGGARAASCGGGRCDGSGRDASSRRGRDAPWPATASARLASATAKTATVDGARRGISRRATGVWGWKGGSGLRVVLRAPCPQNFLPSDLPLAFSSQVFWRWPIASAPIVVRCRPCRADGRRGWRGWGLPASVAQFSSHLRRVDAPPRSGGRRDARKGGSIPS